MKQLLLTATAVGLSLASAPASAGLLAQYSVDGGATFTTVCSDASGGGCSDSFTASNGLDFLFLGASSNSPGTAIGATLFSASVQLSNPTGAAQSIIISVGDTDFTSPVGQVTFLNNLAGTVVTGGAANTLSSIACLDTGNGQNVCPATYQTPTINAAITAPGGGSNTTTLPIASLLGPYAMTELISITLDAGALINYVSSSTVAPVPEPASLGILGLGLLGLGTLYHRRKPG